MMTGCSAGNMTHSQNRCTCLVQRFRRVEKVLCSGAYAHVLRGRRQPTRLHRASVTLDPKTVTRKFNRKRFLITNNADNLFYTKLKSKQSLINKLDYQFTTKFPIPVLRSKRFRIKPFLKGLRVEGRAPRVQGRALPLSA